MKQWYEVWVYDDGAADRLNYMNPDPDRFLRQGGWVRVVELPTLIVHQWVNSKLNNRKTVMWIIHVPIE